MFYVCSIRPLYAEEEIMIEIAEFQYVSIGDRVKFKSKFMLKYVVLIFVDVSDGGANIRKPYYI